VSWGPRAVDRPLNTADLIVDSPSEPCVKAATSEQEASWLATASTSCGACSRALLESGDGVRWATPSMPLPRKNWLPGAVCTL
jgi:hypothetical protein